MAEDRQRLADDCISDADPSPELERVLSQLSLDQIRFVIARQECGTDREAIQQLGMSESTVYHWPPIVKEAVRLMHRDGLVTALHLRRRSLARAMAIKIKLLDTDDERLRDKVATDIIEAELGKALERRELSGPSGAPLLDLQAMVAALRQADEALSSGDDEG